MHGSRRARRSTSSDAAPVAVAGPRRRARPARGGFALALALASTLALSVGAGAPRAETARPAPRKAPARSVPAASQAGMGAARKPAASAAKGAAPAMSGQERLRAEAEYQMLQAELQIAKGDKPYLVFQWEPQPQLLVKLKGAVVAAYPLRLEGGPGEVKRFREEFRGPQRRVVRGLAQKYLYTARDQTPDSVLTIVGGVLNLDPQEMQREIPGWFELKWQDDLVLEVRADVDGQPLPGVDLKIVKLQQTIRRPFGEVRLRVRLDRRDALTVYRLAHPGMPVLSPL